VQKEIEMQKNEISNTTILLILLIGVMLGMGSSRLSHIQAEPLTLLAIPKPQTIPTPEPDIGGEETEIQIPDVAFAFPIAAEDWYVTSPFGARVSPIYGVLRHHNGVDITVKDSRRGMPQIVAVADGVIRDHWLGHPTRGKYIVVDHGGGVVSHYSHLSESYIHERRPDGSRWTVQAGEVIGRMGATGIAFGGHLDFCLEIADELVNPILYLDLVLPEWEVLTSEDSGITLQ
jgi:murein DD-endopeptidase MepM/ murein hydrolase activator NlpD